MFFYLVLLLFWLFVIAPVALWILVIITSPKRGCAALLFALLVYVFMSMEGQYMPSEYGGNDLRLEWCPKGSAHGSPGLSPTWTKASCNVFFIFYLDCILIDRWLWHRTNWEAGAYEFSTNEVVWAYSRYAEE